MNENLQVPFYEHYLHYSLINQQGMIKGKDHKSALQILVLYRISISRHFILKKRRIFYQNYKHGTIVVEG